MRYVNRFREVGKGKVRVLVVDDDEMIRTVFRDILGYHGYQAILAEDGNKALEILSDPRNDIALVVLDLIMPGLSGMEVYTSIRKVRPDIEIVISSGYPIDDETRDFLTGDHVAFVSKPFSVDEFMDKIQAGLQVSGNCYL
jgi:CheY-like chemotaxis protein